MKTVCGAPISPTNLGVVAALLAGAAFALGVFCSRNHSQRADAPPNVAPAPLTLAASDASVDSLQFKLALSNETDFERAHAIHPRFSDCRASTGNAMSCSTFTDEGAPVAYHCDYVGCSIDCGGGK
jgi:hypothetical protein